MSPSTHDEGPATGPFEEERLVDVLAAEAEDDQPEEPALYPLHLLQGEDDVVTETSRDRGGWSAEELAMHLVEEP